MQIQSYQSLALLLSITAHLGLGLALGNGASISGEAVPQQQEPARTIMATLARAESAGKPQAATPANDGQDRAMPAHEPETVIGKSTPETPASPIVPARNVAQKADEGTPLVSLVMPPEPHYFNVSELTEKPLLLRDVPPDQLALPDIFPQPAIVQLLINEDGEIDKVVIEDAFLSEQAQHFVIDAFAKIKFQPGKLGASPVKSQLRIEVTLQNAQPIQ